MLSLFQSLDPFHNAGFPQHGGRGCNDGTMILHLPFEMSALQKHAQESSDNDTTIVSDINRPQHQEGECYHDECSHRRCALLPVRRTMSWEDEDDERNQDDDTPVQQRRVHFSTEPPNECIYNQRYERPSVLWWKENELERIQAREEKLALQHVHNQSPAYAKVLSQWHQTSSRRRLDGTDTRKDQHSPWNQSGNDGNDDDDIRGLENHLLRNELTSLRETARSELMAAQDRLRRVEDVSQDDLIVRALAATARSYGRHSVRFALVLGQP